MEVGEILQRLGIALSLGLIVGLQRERTGAPLAGFRTFPLITLFGALAGLLAQQFGGWILAAALVALAALIVMGNLTQKEDPGLTTEAAMGVMFLIGAFLVSGPINVAVILGGTVAMLLHLKPQMHSVARRLGDEDFRAIMQFVLLSLVILPILPNQSFGPFQVLNPFKIWLMVVLIVGISLGGYIIYKFFGERIGTVAGGVLGGLISSTATTVSYARRTKAVPDAAATASLVIMAASTIVFIRVLILIGASAPHFLPVAVYPIGIIMAGLAVICAAAWWGSETGQAKMPEQTNPSELKAALIFAGLYALVLLGTAAAREYFGSRGLYVVAVLSGLTDMDTNTFSVSQMVGTGGVPPGTGWRLVVVAALANLAFKAGIVAALGSKQLLKRMGLLFGCSAAVAAAVLVFWQDSPEGKDREEAPMVETDSRAGDPSGSSATDGRAAEEGLRAPAGDKKTPGNDSRGS